MVLRSKSSYLYMRIYVSVSLYVYICLYIYMSILSWAPEFHKKNMVRKLNFPFSSQLRKNHFRVSDPPGILLDRFFEIWRYRGREIQRDIEIQRYRHIERYRDTYIYLYIYRDIQISRYIDICKYTDIDIYRYTNIQKVIYDQMQKYYKN